MWERIKTYFKEHSQTEKKKLSEMSFTEKCAYIWEYYKLQIIGFIVLVVVVTSIVHNIMNPPLPAYAGAGFYEIYFSDEFYDGLKETITKTLIADPGAEEFYIHQLVSGDDPSMEMAIAQKLMAMVMVNEIDFIISTEDYFASFAYQDFFLDIGETDIAVPEELLFYSETSENPMVLPYGANLKNSALFKELGLAGGVDVYIGIISNTIRMDNVKAIFDLLLAE